MKRLGYIKNMLSAYNKERGLDAKYHLATNKLIDEMKSYEIDAKGLSDIELLDYYETTYDKVKSGSSEMFGYNLQNGFMLYEYKVEDGFVAILLFHDLTKAVLKEIYNSKHKNYFIALKFNQQDEIFEILNNLCTYDNEFCYSVDGKKYSVALTISKEMSIYDIEKDDYFMVNASSDEQLEKEIRKHEREG